MSQEIEGSYLGPEFSGYIFRITGGNDQEGFAMKQGILKNSRVKLLLDASSGHYRPGRTGERKRRSVRGCIVGSDLVTLAMVVVKQGDNHLPGLTDNPIGRRLGPKRASKIRKLFNLSKEDDVRKYVLRREIKPKNADKKSYFKSPKIQRLITPVRLQRKRRIAAEKVKRSEASKAAASAYAELLSQRQKADKAKKQQDQEKRRLSSTLKSQA